MGSLPDMLALIVGEPTLLFLLHEKNNAQKRTNIKSPNTFIVKDKGQI